MKIATQNTGAIVPIFIAMALLLGALTYRTARSEIRWGLEEEASSLAVSIAEFVDGDSTYLAGRRNDAYMATLDTPITRVLGRGQAHRVYLYSKAMDTTLYERAADSTKLGAPEPALLRSKALANAMEQDSFYVVEQPSRVPAQLSAFAPVLDSKGRLVAVLGVVTDANILAVESRRLIIRFIEITGIAALLGLFVSLFVSSVVTRQTRALGAAAHDVAEGRYDRQVNVGVIRELSDLSLTFNTMSSVLRDFIEKTRRSLIESEQFRTAGTLASTYAEEADTQWVRTGAGIRVVALRVGRGHPSDFCGAVETGNGLCAFVGQVRTKNELDAAIAAGAAARYARREITRTEPRAALEDTVRVFDAHRLKAVVATADSDSIEVCFFATDAEPDCSSVVLGPGDSIVLHTFADDIRKDIGSFKRLYQHLPVDELAHELARSLGATLDGTLLVIGRSQST